VRVRQQYAGLDLDLADAMAVILAADHGTDAVLTVDQRDFRTAQPLTNYAAFRFSLSSPTASGRTSSADIDRDRPR